jgi:hypothetical protein
LLSTGAHRSQQTSPGPERSYFAVQSGTRKRLGAVAKLDALG